MNLDLVPYLLEAGVAVLLLAMVVSDSFLRADQKGTIWGLGSLGLLVLLGASFLLEPQAPASMHEGWALDSFALFFKRFFLLTGLFAMLSIREFAPRFRHGEGEYYSLSLFACLGGMMLASAMDWITLFVSLELMTVTMFILVTWSRKDKKSLEAGMKYLIVGTFSSAFLLYGIAYLYGYSGTTRLGELHAFLSHHQDAFDVYLWGRPVLGSAPELSESSVFGIVFGILMVFAGLFFKIAAFPFHVWAPDVYEGAPTPTTGLLAVASKGAGVVLALRLGVYVFAPVALDVVVAGERMPLVALLAALTIAYGSLAAIPQWNIKRLMGYSSIAHAGYLLMGLALGSELGLTAVCYYLVAYLFTNWGLFLVLSCLDRYENDSEITSLAGLGRRSPILGVTLTFALLSLAGIPPMGGFFGKLLLLMAAFGAKYYWLAAVGMLMAVVSMYVYLGVLKQIYAEDPEPGVSQIEISGWASIGCVVACLGMLGTGLWQAPLLGAAFEAAQSLF